MLRKTNLLGIASLLIASPCFSGFYVGAGFGPEYGHFKQRAHIISINPSHSYSSFDVIDVNHFSGIGMFGSLFGGYGWKHNRFYLAVEGNANLSSLQYKLSNLEQIRHNLAVTTFEVTNSEGIGLLPGIFLSDAFLLYGRVGYANGRVKIKESDPTILGSTSNRNGVRYGAGIRYNMLERWSFMMDYSQINYSDSKSSTYDPFGNVYKSTRIYPTTAQVDFGVIYNFDVPKKVFVK